MNSSGFRGLQPYSAGQICTSTDTAISNHGSLHCSSLISGDLSSYWHSSSGRSDYSQKKLKCCFRCTHDIKLQCSSIRCIRNTDDVRQSILSEKEISPVFPINLSSCLRGWLSQLLHSNSTKENKLKLEKDKVDSQPGGFELFVRDYQIEKGVDPLPNYILDPFTNTEPSSFKESKVSSINPRALAEVAISDLLTVIPSIDALRNIPYFDMLQKNLLQVPDGPCDSIMDQMIAVERIEKTDARDLQRRQFVSTDEFGSPEALACWLSNRLPEGISQWGVTPGTKRVTNLWLELKEGEIVLEDTYPPRRTVHVASVKIRNKTGHMLVEAHQEMADGSIRLRNRPLSEKMRPGENVEEACFRGILEELGEHLGARNRVRILLGSYQRELEERESLSYPGLLTCYVIHSVDAVIEDLPETGFYTVENELMSHSATTVESGSEIFCSRAAVGVRKHFWRWVPQSS